MVSCMSRAGSMRRIVESNETIIFNAHAQPSCRLAWLTPSISQLRLRLHCWQTGPLYSAGVAETSSPAPTDDSRGSAWHAGNSSFRSSATRRSALPADRARDRADIRRGRLRPGDPLPGTRTLARALGVQRLTVVSAFDDLVAEGWLVTQRARGTFVSKELPDPEAATIRSAEVARGDVDSRRIRPPPRAQARAPI